MPKGMFGTSAMSEGAKQDSVKGHSVVGMTNEGNKDQQVKGLDTRGDWGTRTPESKVEQIGK